MRFRLIQARRATDAVRDEERAAFAARLGVPTASVLPHDLLTEPTTATLVARGVDAVLVGGAGEFSVLMRDLPWMPPFIDTLGELAAQRVPTFASCFGFQALVLALGGEVVHAPDRAEVGTFPVHLLPNAADDPLFGHLPPTFDAQLGHKDHAAGWPPGVTPLAASARCPYQAFRIPNAPVWATQFHPELTQADNLSRLDRYHDHYVEAFGEEAFYKLREGFTPSPHADGLLGRFAGWLRG